MSKLASLPRPRDQLNIWEVVPENGEPFKVRIQIDRVMKALEWLWLHNPCYANIKINETAKEDYKRKCYIQAVRREPSSDSDSESEDESTDDERDERMLQTMPCEEGHSQPGLDDEGFMKKY